MTVSGRNKRGYCKLCDSPLRDAINSMIEAGKNAAEIKRWTEQGGLTFDRTTLYKHRDDNHAKHPLVSAVEEARSKAPLPKTNRGFLEMIRDLGAEKAMNNPDEVSLDHAIKAATALEKSDSGGKGVYVILAKMITGAQPPETITMLPGEYKELPIREDQAEDGEYQSG